MKTYFITATGTDIGKTYVTAALARQLIGKGFKVAVIKPVISGYDDAAETDSSIFAAITGASVEDISPWRFKAPVGADLAAAKEGRAVTLDEIVEFCQQPRDVDYLLIEGAGGVMSPLCAGKTFLDLIHALEAHIILVAGSYVGSISHVMTALRVIEEFNCQLVISESENSAVTAEETVESLKMLTGVPMYIVKRNLAPDLMSLIQ